MFQREGARGLFRGMLINCMAGIPFSSLEFFLYDLAKNNLFQGLDKSELTLGHKFVCGGCAGWGTQAVMTPLWVIKTVYSVDQRQHARNQGSLLMKSAKQIYHHSGILGYYKGFSVTMARIFPLIALQQSTFDHLRNEIFKM